MSNWNKVASKETVEAIIPKLEERGIAAFFVNTGKEAKEKALELIPKGSRILVSASVTAEQIGLKNEIENSKDFISVRTEYMVLDHDKDKDKIRILRSTPDIIVGSVHAVTEKGEVLIASNTGSQLAGYVSAAGKVIWIVGAQKIVDNLEEGMERIYQYVLPLESERLKKLFGVPSNVSKLLIFNKETTKKRVNLIFVNEVLGF